MILGFLDYYRETIVRKIEGLTEEQARWKPAPTANSLLNIVYHLAGVERGWFQSAIAGLGITRDRDTEFTDLPAEITIESAVSLYRAECDRSNEIARSVGSLDDLCKGEWAAKRSIRWVVLHMLEETARHAGHADITRELIDGSVDDS